MMKANRVFRSKTIDGLVTPAFIHNGNYYFINMPVFADGLVNCWEMVDLAIFRSKLQSGWVVGAVPDGQTVSVHGLGAWTASGGQWELSTNDLYEQVLSLVRQLNPRMENLHDCQGRTIEEIRGVKTFILPSGQERPLRLVNPESVFPDRVSGASISVLVRDRDYWVADLRVFADGTIELGRLPRCETLTLDALQRFIEDGRMVETAPAGSRMHFHGLGSLIVAEEHYCVDPREQIREVSDLVDKLNDRPDSLARCRSAHTAYLANPTVALRDALREAYEAVPQHNRRYVGDMDTKDIEVRMIVYGEQELENWSHRVVGRRRGMSPLPNIRVPKPRDE